MIVPLWGLKISPTDCEEQAKNAVWYWCQRDNLTPHKFVVIAGKKLEGEFETFDEAINALFNLSNFLERNALLFHVGNKKQFPIFKDAQVLAKLWTDKTWYWENRDNIMAKHAEMAVAVYDKQIVAEAGTIDDVFDAASTLLLEARAFFLTSVGNEEYQEPPLLPIEHSSQLFLFESELPPSELTEMDMIPIQHDKFEEKIFFQGAPHLP
jgi:hypothetical protein